MAILWLKQNRNQLTGWIKCISLYFPRIYNITRINSVNKTTHLIPALENLQCSESCYKYLNIYSFLYYAAFSISPGPGCCRKSSQTSRPGERRDGRGTCKCCLWKVGIHQITHKALNVLLMLAREVLFRSQQPSGLDNTTCTHMTTFIEISSSLSQYWQFIIHS